MYYDYILVGAGPSSLTFSTLVTLQCNQEVNKKSKLSLLIIDENSSIGGCHRVERINTTFNEHSPRVYSNVYINLQNIFNKMDMNFYDYFIEYKFQLTTIAGEKNPFNFIELVILIKDYLIFVYNKNYLNETTLESYLYKNKFTNKTINYINRICILTDGAYINRYTVNKFFNLLNQNSLYKLYQPKKPNDIALLKDWKEYLLKNNVNFQLNYKVDYIYKEKNDKLWTIRTSDTSIVNNYKTYKCTNLILAIPPINILKILQKSNLNIDTFIDNFEKFVFNSKYENYITIVFIWNTVLDTPNIYGHIDSAWGVIFVDYSKYFKKCNKTIISCSITFLNNKSSRINKTANECSKKEIVIEVFNQINDGYSSYNYKLPSNYKYNLTGITYSNGEWVISC
jgi:hypothetical protein